MASLRGLVRTARTARPAASAPCVRRGPSPTAAAAAAANQARRSSSAAFDDAVFDDLEAESSFRTAPLPDTVRVPSPQERAAQRTTRLPGSRYQYHPPKYDRGPLHPVQSPASSDPTARDFVPGPFHQARLRQTYQATIAADLMTLAYTHTPPGPPGTARAAAAAAPRERLRSWDGSSPYHANRPLRGPRGDSVLRPLERAVTFRRVPEVRAVHVAVFVPEAIREPDRLVVARTVVQAITGVVPAVTTVRRNVAQWGVVRGQRAGVKASLYGDAAYEFLDKCVHLVFPRIKDWQGVPGTTGDSAGNLAWGLTSQDVALFPEIEANYSMYPAKLIPGFRMFVETTATSDRQARLLLSAFGVPFYGKLRD